MPLFRPAWRRATFPGGEGFRRFLPHCGGEPGVAAAESGTRAGGPLCPSRRHPEPTRPPPSAPYTAPPTRERHRFLREPSPGSGNPPAARGVLFSHFPIFSPPRSFGRAQYPLYISVIIAQQQTTMQRLYDIFPNIQKSSPEGEPCLSKKPRRVWRRKPPNKIKSFSVGACT